MTSKFVISLDFELLWGVRDHANRDSYGANILGARKAIPEILKLFEKNKISATWATVGFLLCSSRDDLMASLPPADLRPTYQDARLSAYAYFDEVGANEAEDPFYFGASLIHRIRQTPNQEIGTHTLSHYYCLEPGQTDLQFEADLTAAVFLDRRRGIDPTSIVFPRNQYANNHLEISKKLRFGIYLGAPKQWIYQSAMVRDQTPMRRVWRLVDAHSREFGDTSFGEDELVSANVPTSQFFAPLFW